MSKYHFFFCLIVVLCLISFGCGSIYMPNVPANPMFSSQGEAYLAGHVNYQGNVSGTAGIALTNHVAVLASASTVSHGRKSSTHYKQWLAEGSIGYFTQFDKSNKRIVELYAGYGVGNSQEMDQRATVHGYEVVDARFMDFNKIFIQANYSSKANKKIKLFGEKRTLNYGTVFRLSRIGMTNFLLNEVSSPKEENLFIEPVFFTRMELAPGLQLQYSTGFNIGLLDNSYLKAGNNVFTLGLVYNLGKSKK